MKKLVMLAIALAVAAAVLPPEASPQAATGVIEGQVSLEPPPPPRRSPNRYPGGPAETHQVQPLPPFVYVVGRVPGAPASSAGRTMMQRDTTFVPRVVAVGAGATVAFPNGDEFFHNVFSYSSAQRFDLGRYPQGESKSVTFTEPGIVEVFCEVHEFMRGAIVVTENPFHAVVGEDGTFRIEGVPAGEYTLAFWHADHELLEQAVTASAGGTARVEVELRR